MSQAERELQSALDALPAPAARPAFRDALRVQFLSRSADEAADVVPALDAAEVPSARPEFRFALRERFLGAELEQELPEVPELEDVPADVRPVAHRRPAPARTRRTDRTPRRTPTGAPRGRRNLALVLGGIAGLAAAALVTQWFLRPADQPTPWSLDGDVAALRIDGRAVSADADATELARLITAAVSVRHAGDAADEAVGPLRLRVGDLFVVEMSPGSELDLSGVPDDLVGDIRLAMRGDRGGFGISTGPAYAEGVTRLMFETPDAVITAVGTTFGVDRYLSDNPGMSGTCVCCCEGQVLVRETDQSQQWRVDAEKMAFVYHSDLPTAEGAIVADHRTPIERLMHVW